MAAVAMHVRGRRPSISNELLGQIDESLVRVTTARVELERTMSGPVPLPTRRAAHTELRHAFEYADTLLRQATAIAKERSYREWSLWRDRLSRLDAARQMHLFIEQDDSGVLPTGTVRAIDTGMTAPNNGELQHGCSKPPGSPATYGLDVDAMLIERSLQAICGAPSGFRATRSA